MFDELLYKLGIKEKPRSEKVKDAFSEAIHTVADALDQAVGETRKEAPKVAKKAQKAAKKAQKEAPKAAKQAQKQVKQASEELGQRAGDARDQMSQMADTLSARTAQPREQAVEALSQGADTAGKKTAALLAALGALTADWDQIAKTLVEEVGKALPSEEAVDQRVEQAQTATKKAIAQHKQKPRGFPGFWVWLLRLGVGVWYIEKLRSKDVAEYIDYGASQRLKRAATNHPVAWYQEQLNQTLIPNASLVALAEVVASALVGVAYITGANRRLAAMLGLLVSGNDLLADFKEHDERGQNLVLLLSQLLLLRTGA